MYNARTIVDFSGRDISNKLKPNEDGIVFPDDDIRNNISISIVKSNRYFMVVVYLKSGKIPHDAYILRKNNDGILNKYDRFRAAIFHFSLNLCHDLQNNTKIHEINIDVANCNINLEGKPYPIEDMIFHIRGIDYRTMFNKMKEYGMLNFTNGDPR